MGEVAPGKAPGRAVWPGLNWGEVGDGDGDGDGALR
jgi:hypothetical protein